MDNRRHISDQPMQECNMNGMDEPHREPLCLGEPSTTRRMRRASSGDPRDCEHDRPFKKARYVWQLKGKYHLKADCARKSMSHHQHSHSRTIRQRPNSNNSSDTDSDAENKSHMSNRKQESNIINSLLRRSNAIDEDMCEEELVSNIDKSISDDIPVTLVKPNNCSQDEYLEKWQAMQVAKSYVDNTINSLLDLWKIAPCDPSELVDDGENDEQVEDEGILMAIQSHGLQAATVASTSQNQNVNPPLAPLGFNDVRQTVNSSDSGDSADSDHFLSAAVSVAIQKKGLASYNYG